MQTLLGCIGAITLSKHKGSKYLHSSDSNTNKLEYENSFSTQGKHDG